jgi:hypothetical protein
MGFAPMFGRKSANNHQEVQKSKILGEETRITPESNTNHPRFCGSYRFHLSATILC